MRRLFRLLEEKPWLRNAVVAVVRGRPVTLGELADMARRGDPDAVAVAERLGMDPEEELWQLAEEYFRRIRGYDVRIYLLGSEMTVDEILDHIRRRDMVGRRIVEMYRRVLEVLRRSWL